MQTHLRGCSSMVEPEPSKLMTRVRFPSPAPKNKQEPDEVWLFFYVKQCGSNPNPHETACETTQQPDDAAHREKRGGSYMPSPRTKSISSCCEWTPSFAYMCLTWVATVFFDRNKASRIYGRLRPHASRSKTSVSLFERDAPEAINLQRSTKESSGASSHAVSADSSVVRSASEKQTASCDIAHRLSCLGMNAMTRAKAPSRTRHQDVGSIASQIDSSAIAKPII